ncbi:endolytic transglycosylase MltG [Agitococcus lubricus]|uniref:Endolytic murein transglycosylase n=1 Tax=Agitococcus lubricus TaxID=1077255 RepID=A0A2T5IZ95_9GAMM|nr:endolytic transglycosylase MltG [Agitococcus lubricus]PTQ89368.1 UPF0755 protein [Agitococcus lubricus]
MSDTPKPPRKPRAARTPKTGTETSTKPRKPRAKRATTRIPKNNPPQKQFHLLRSSVIMVLVCLCALLAWGYWGLLKTIDVPTAGYKLQIDKGQHYADVIEQLNSDGVLPSTVWAKLYLRFHTTKPLQTGTYLFKPPLNTMQLLAQLSNGEGLVMTKITVVEGISFKQLRQQLARHPQVKQTLSHKTDSEVLALLGIEERHPEGLFAPDTYIFPPDETDIKILSRLYQQQQKILKQAWANRAANLPYQSPYDALIMASIVEKETANAAERPQIAGVFVRRLQQGMRLQTDPTVIYGMGDSYNGNIRKTDLLTYTPYNTYRINGLPPTPIALPSKAAIEAALNPAAGTEVYFVAKGDGTGRHTFSTTLNEHNRAVQAYLQARKGP